MSFSVSSKSSLNVSISISGREGVVATNVRRRTLVPMPLQHGANRMWKALSGANSDIDVLVLEGLGRTHQQALAAIAHDAGHRGSGTAGLLAHFLRGGDASSARRGDFQ